MIHNCVKRRKPLNVRIEGAVAHIEVHGETFIMDAEDIRLLDGWTLHISKGHVCLRGTRIETPIFIVRLSRLLLNAPRGMEVDHISGNTLDNRKANLRVCTRTENARNTSSHSDSACPYKGCSYDKRSRKWHAQICANRTYYHLGYFHVPEAAAEAYNAKARELFGEFARIETPRQTARVR